MFRPRPYLMVAAAALIAAPTARAEDKYLETVKVTDRIYVFKPRIEWTHGNGVAIIGDDGVFFIDTYIQSNYAEEAIRRLRQITKLPVRFVLNTHWHYDHVVGNGVFKRAFPGSVLIAHDSTAASLETNVATYLKGEAENIRSTIAQLSQEIHDGKITRSGIAITGSMKPFWELMLREAQEYQQAYRPRPFVSADLTFSDSLTIRWGGLTLRLIHLAENGHSAGDVIVWIPETRLVVTGDIVVAPTPYATYYNTPGMLKAFQALTALDPAIIVPGHGAVQYDLSYLQLLTRAFGEYRRAAETAISAKVPVKQALDSIAFPAIDRLFTGDDALKRWAYRAFFVRNLVNNTYRSAGALPGS